MQISYLLGRNTKLKLSDIVRSMTSQTNHERKKGIKKILLTSIAALSLLRSGWVAANTPYAK